MAEGPNPTPGTNAPEPVIDTLSGLRVEVKQAKDLNAVSDTLVGRTLTALEDARKQAMTIGETARDGLRAELAQWNLDHVPTVLKDAVESTKTTIESIYKGFQEKTVLFPEISDETNIGKISSFINMFSEIKEKIAEWLLPMFMSLGISIPDSLQPKGLGMKELYAALISNKRTLESSDKDEEHMREIIGILGELNGTKPLANQMPLAALLARAVELAPFDKKALTTKDVLDSAKLFAEKVKKAETPSASAAAPAATPATPAAAPAPAPAAAAPAAAPAAGTSPTPAATT